MNARRDHLTLQLSRGQSAALLASTAALVGVALMALTASASALGDIVVWCRDFLLAVAPGGSARTAALGVGVAAGAAAFAALARFAVVEAVRGARIRRAIARGAVRPSSRVTAAALAAGGAPATVVEDAERYAFTFGLVRPRIVVSTGLVSALTAAELAAVLRHESVHLVRRDPRRSFFWAALRSAFFFLPALRDVAEHVALGRELAADAAIVGSRRGRRTLASALFKVAGGPVSAAATSFGQMRWRVRAIEEPGRGTALTVPAHRAAFTAAAAAALAATLAVLAAPAPARASPQGLQCTDAAEMRMSTVNFSPYLRIGTLPISSTEVGGRSEAPGP
jgi:Zn-dependent protease with chaperone function